MTSYQYITINGKKVEYMKFGEGPVLFFLHGGMLRVKAFLPSLERLSENYTIVAPNLPGHGASEPTNRVNSLEVASYHFLDFLKAIDVKPKYIVGYSLGGGIALHLSTHLKVSKLLVADPFVRPIKLTYKEFFKIYLIDIPMYWYNNGGDKGHFVNVLKDHVGNMWDIKGEIPKIFKDILYLYENNKIEVKEVKTRTMLLWGKDDQLFDSNLAKEFASENSHIKYESVDGDHTWPLMYPDLFAEKIDSYCKEGSLIRRLFSKNN